MAADKGRIELSHGQAGDADMPPQNRSVAGQHHGAVELMGLARQRQQMAARGFHVGRLMKHFVAERQRLVAAEHQGAGLPLADLGGLGLGQHQGNILGRDTAALQRCFERALVDLRRNRLDRDAGMDKHRLAERAARGKDDFFGHFYSPIPGAH